MALLFCLAEFVCIHVFRLSRFLMRRLFWGRYCKEIYELTKQLTEVFLNFYLGEFSKSFFLSN